MKAILASGNFVKVDSAVELVEKMTCKSRKYINVAVINEASAVEFGDHRWAIENLNDLANVFGGSIEIVHLLAISPEQIIERVNAADIIFVLGGNTEWLKIVFDKTGMSRALPEILEKKLYVGSSAGSMILGHRQSSKVQDQIYGSEEYFGVKNYLDLLDFSILPHCFYDSGNQTKNWVIKKASESVNYPVYALSDKAAIIINGDNVSVIGSGYMKLVNGEEVEI